MVSRSPTSTPLERVEVVQRQSPSPRSPVTKWDLSRHGWTAILTEKFDGGIFTGECEVTEDFPGGQLQHQADQRPVLLGGRPRCRRADEILD